MARGREGREQLRQQRKKWDRQNRRAIYVGTVVTGVATPFFFVLPDLLPAEALRWWIYDEVGVLLGGPGANPFDVLRVFGTILGPAVAGWLTAEQGSAMITGLKAAVYGLLLGWCLGIGLLAIGSLVLYGLVFPPPILEVTVVPLVYAVILLPFYIVLGAIAGGLASLLKQGLHCASRNVQF